MDRRRINGPVGTTYAPVYDKSQDAAPKPVRTRPADLVRKIYLQTGVTPSASGSAYLELAPEHPGAPGLKLSCTVHGPHALPRSMPFSPHLVLATHVKYAPFATRARRGYQRDGAERDLAVHLETSLRGAVLGERWPKSGVDLVVSVVEGGDPDDDDGFGAMTILSGCITVAAAALADAGIDCVDTVAGGVAGVVVRDADDNDNDGNNSGNPRVVVDPVPGPGERVVAACCVAYLPNRDEVTNLWVKGRLPGGIKDGDSSRSDGDDSSSSSSSSEEEDDTDKPDWHTALLDKALYAARQADEVLVAALKETVEESS